MVNEVCLAGEILDLAKDKGVNFIFPDDYKCVNEFKAQTFFIKTEPDFDKETNFYKKISLLWTLKGKREQVKLRNEEELERADKILSGIKYLLNPLEFYEEELTKHETIQEKLSRLKQY